LGSAWKLGDFRAQFDSQGNSLGNKIYIVKPDTGCQGRGIFLTRTFDQVPQHENVVAQLYIKKPLLLDGFKFDLRIYCLISSVKPLRMYLFHDGLVRMCTEEYGTGTSLQSQRALRCQGVSSPVKGVLHATVFIEYEHSPV
jgi:tubulin polyglutamylase TTLL6/13